MKPTIRTIREEPKFREQLDSLALHVERLDEVTRGVYYSLATRPEKFETVAGCISVLKTEAYPKAPALRFFFTYTQDEVHLLGVEFVGE